MIELAFAKLVDMVTRFFVSMMNPVWVVRDFISMKLACARDHRTCWIGLGTFAKGLAIALECH